MDPGEAAIMIPEMFQIRNPWKGEQFKGLSDDTARLSLWLAERRATLKPTQPVKHSIYSPITPDAIDFEASYIRSLPTLDDYRDSGVPLAAPEEDLARLKDLPKLG